MNDAPDPRADLAERHFAANVRTAREARGMSQAELARRMAELGWPWHQQTVGRIEAGQRNVRLGEAKDIAAVLETTVDALSAPTWEDALIEGLMAASTATRRVWQQHAEGDLALRAARSQLADRIQAARSAAKDSERVDIALGVAEDTYLMTEPLGAGTSEPKRNVRPRDGSDVTH